MRRQFFWLFTAGVFALICHVTYLLFVPSRSFSSAVDASLGPDQLNRFSVLDVAEQVKLLPFAAAEHIVGVCKFNVKDGPVKVTAQLPEGFWSFAVYTIRGEQVYAINDTQADSNTFTVEMSRDNGLLSRLFGGYDDAVDVTANDIGWRIAVKENEGLAVLWMAVGDPLLRNEAEDVIKKSRCGRVDG